MHAAPSRRLAEHLAKVEAIAPILRAHSDRSERESRLAPEIAEAFHDTGLFRLLLQERLNGGGLTIPEALRVFEAVARIDASAAWNLAICGDGPLFGHFVAREAFDEIFSDPRAVLVGTLNPATVRALPCDGGYRFSGRATYLSGSAQATWVMCSGVEVREARQGAPAIRTGLFPFAHCKPLDTWSVAGMRGTGSHDALFEDVFVPHAFTYQWPDPKPSWDVGAFGRIPLPTQLGGALATVAVGASRHALDAFGELAGAKVPVGGRAALRERTLAQIQLAQAEGLVRAADVYLRAANDEVWRRGEAGEPFDLHARADARLASVTAVKLCAQAIDLLHDAAGMTAVQSGHALERCWRDIHTMTQHVILGTTRFEVIGRIYLGLDPASPII